MKKLQVLIDGQWEYVFCRNELKRNPITTNEKSKAITGDNHSLTYFQRYFANLSFRVI